MKVLLIEPMEHPKEIDIQPTLEEYYKVLDCDCITATYPWPEPVALVTDTTDCLRTNCSAGISGN